MSREKHLEGDTGELSESEVRSTTVLPEPRSTTLDRLAGHCQGDLSAITKRLKELADQKSAYMLKYREMTSKGQIHDAAIEQRRTEEDENYEAILTAREHEDERRRQIRTAEDAELRKKEKRLYDEEQELRRRWTRIRQHRPRVEGPLLSQPARPSEKRKQLEMTSPVVQPPIYPLRRDHRRKASAGENFGLLESDAISVSSEGTALVFEPHDPSSSRQSPPVRMGFRCSFCNRGFERKSYRDEHERNHRSNLSLMELCNEPDCGKRFSNKNLLRRHVKSVHIKAKQFICDNCGKVFARQDYVVRHTRSKNGCSREYQFV